jgi:hypothetical protein
VVVLITGIPAFPLRPADARYPGTSPSFDKEQWDAGQRFYDIPQSGKNILYDEFVALLVVRVEINNIKYI